jgi:hypothetical protein
VLEPGRARWVICSLSCYAQDHPLTHAVWRKDGTRVTTIKQATWALEFKAVFSLLVSRRILLLLPAFFISYFYNGFVSTWLTSYFVSAHFGSAGAG